MAAGEIVALWNTHCDSWQHCMNHRIQINIPVSRMKCFLMFYQSIYVHIWHGAGTLLYCIFVEYTTAGCSEI